MAPGTNRSTAQPAGQLNHDELVNLLHVSFVSHYMPDVGVDADIAQYPMDEIKYTNPYQLGDEKSQLTTFPRSRQEEAFMSNTDNLWHWPLLKIGDAAGNSSFARCSVCHTQPDVLYVSFRPLDLDRIEEIARRDYFYTGAIRKYCMPGFIRPCLHERSVDNVVSLVHDINKVEVDPETGMSSGYYKLVNQDIYPITLENLTRLKQEGAGADGPVVDMRFDSDTAFGSTFHTTMADAVVWLIKHNNQHGNAARNHNHFREVIFNGFSLGSGTALACAYTVHKLLESHREREGDTFLMPKVTCIQFSGTTVGNANFEAEVKSRGIATYYIALKNSGEAGIAQYDPVNYMPFDQAERVHVADKFIELEFNNPHSIQVGKHQRERLHGRLSKHALLQMAFMYILNWDDSSGAARNCGLTGFKRTHLAGENMITSTLLTEVSCKIKSNKWVKRVPWVQAAL